MSIDSLPLRRSPWTIGSRAVIGAALHAVAGLLFVFTDVWLQEGVDSGTALVNHLVVLSTDGVGIVVLVPALDIAWDFLSQQAGS